MASYTMQLRAYIESFSQFQEGLSWRDRIEIGRKYLFDFPYPIFDEEYRPVFETNFIRNFYMREIGSETEALFKFQLETWLNINMPYYNNLFESELFDYDPLMNSQMVVAHDKTNNRDQKDQRDTSVSSQSDGTSNSKATQKGSSTGETNEDKFRRDVESSTPDTRLNLTTNDGKGIIEYASKLDEDSEKNKSTAKGSTSGEMTGNDTTKNTSKGNQSDTGQSQINDAEHFIQRRFGKVGVQTYPKMIQDYRNALLRVERDMHKDMAELFMLLY